MSPRGTSFEALGRRAVANNLAFRDFCLFGTVLRNSCENRQRSFESDFRVFCNCHREPSGPKYKDNTFRVSYPVPVCMTDWLSHCLPNSVNATAFCFPPLAKVRPRWRPPLWCVGGASAPSMSAHGWLGFGTAVPIANRFAVHGFRKALALVDVSGWRQLATVMGVEDFVCLPHATPKKV